VLKANIATKVWFFVIGSLQFETALAKLHGVRPEGVDAFLGRCRHLKKIGVVKGSGGRGRRLSYSLKDIEALTFALELSAYKVDPSIVGDFVEIYRPQIHAAFDRVRHEANRGKNEAQVIYLAFVADFWKNPPRASADDARMRWLSMYTLDELVADLDNGKFRFWLGHRVGLIDVSFVWYKLREFLPQLDELVTKEAANNA
jgi:hypothetical protein